MSCVEDNHLLMIPLSGCSVGAMKGGSLWYLPLPFYPLFVRCVILLSSGYLSIAIPLENLSFLVKCCHKIALPMLLILF